MRRRGWLVVLLLAVALFLIGGRLLTLLVVDHQWFEAMGQERLWWERLASQVILQGGLAAIGSLFAYANFSAVRATILAVAVPQRVGNIELNTMVPAQRLTWITALLAVIVGVALAAPFDDWTILTMVRHGVPFGEIEGYHDRDLGFYVYWLPFEELLYLWSMVAVVVMTAMVTVLYALTRSVRLSGRRFLVSTHARRHITVLGSLVLLLLSWSYRLDGFDLLRAGSGRDGLFLRVDHVVTLRVDVVLAVAAVAAAFVFFRSGWLGHTRSALITLTVMLAAGLLLRHGVPSLLERGSFIGDPARRDADYLATRALVTRRAYDVDAIRTIPHADPDSSAGRDRTSGHGPETVPIAAIGERAALWDAASAQRLWPAAEAQNPQSRRLQVMVGSSFVRTGSGTIGLLEAIPLDDGHEWQLMSRDLTMATAMPAPLPVVLAGSTQSGRYGKGVFEPLVGPGIDGYAVVEDSLGIIPGTRLNSLVSRLSHAWFARDAKLLQEPEGLRRPGVFVPYRDVRVRLSVLAPVFAQATHILPMEYQDSVYWVVDLYSASSDYPLSQQWFAAGDIRSYFRHAGTALVAAATGVVRIVQVEHPDPIAETWMKLLPSLFVDPAELPADLLSALPPPTDGALTQLRSFARFGSRSEGEAVVPRQFPDSTLSPLWAAPVLLAAGEGAENLVPALSVPLLDSGGRLAGVAAMVGGKGRQTYWAPVHVGDLQTRSDWQRLTEALRSAVDSARTPKDAGPRYPEKVAYGRVHAILAGTGPILMQPVHFSSVDGASPGTRVAVMSQDRVETGRDLYEVASILSGMHVLPPVRSDDAGPQLHDSIVLRLYDQMREALRRADWVRFGVAFDSLGRLLGRQRD